MRGAFTLLVLAGCASAPPPAPRHPVRAVNDHDVWLSMQADAGSRVALHRRAWTSDAAEPVTDAVVAVGTVASSDESGTRVRVGMNEEVRQGDWADPTDLAVTADLWMPPRIGDLWVVRGAVRGLAVLDADPGGGASTDVRLAYHFDAPLVVAAEWTPFVIAGGPFGVLTTRAHAVVGLDFREVGFEAGAGFGIGHQEDSAPGLSVRQHLRVGSRDGVHLTATFSETMTRAPFRLGADTIAGWVVTFHLGAQLPVPDTHGVWITAEGGGADVAALSGRAGLRWMLIGAGGGESLYLTPQLEVLRLQRVRDSSGESMWGLGLGLDVEGRI